MKKFTRRDMVKLGAGFFGFLPLVKHLSEVPEATAQCACPTPTTPECGPGRTYESYTGDICIPEDHWRFGYIHRVYEVRDVITNKLCRHRTEQTNVICDVF
jgi:hypothetical protein